jgi:hypothetical protein
LLVWESFIMSPKTAVMKALLFAAGLLFCAAATAQDYPEFRDQPNGLMYSDASMKVLRRMVDSLNLRFKTCDLSRPFYSYPQAKMYYVTFSSKNKSLHDIRSDLFRQLPFDSLIKKYKRYISDIDTTQLCILLGYDEKNNSSNVLEGNAENGYEDHEIAIGKNEPVKNKWFYKYVGKDKYNDTYDLYCRFFPEEFTQQQLPAKYAALIQYVDCMIDTNARIFLTPTSNEEADISKVLSPIREHIHNNLGLLVDPLNWISYMDDSAMTNAANKIRNDEKLRDLINTAIDRCVKDGQSNNYFEEFVAKVVSPQAALKLKRSRTVWGMCSQDPSPRIHARNIALLAAESNSWDIFLRSHLDIMNDRFNRMSDGSYAYASRKTYLKELEELNLNITDLMLGLTLRAQNVADNHYYGTVWRIGWALTESKERKEFEVRLIEMLKDVQLDSFNRGLLFILFSSYLNHIDDKVEAQELMNKIKNNKQVFPQDLQVAIASLRVEKD